MPAPTDKSALEHQCSRCPACPKRPALYGQAGLLSLCAELSHTVVSLAILFCISMCSVWAFAYATQNSAQLSKLLTILCSYRVCPHHGSLNRAQLKGGFPSWPYEVFRLAHRRGWSDVKPNRFDLDVVWVTTPVVSASNVFADPQLQQRS